MVKPHESTADTGLVNYSEDSLGKEERRKVTKKASKLCVCVCVCVYMTMPICTCESAYITKHYQLSSPVHCQQNKMPQASYLK